MRVENSQKRRGWYRPERRYLIIVALLAFFSASFLLLGEQEVSALDTVPTKMNFQGRLTDSTGNIKPNGNYNMRMKLYTVDSGGSPVWSSDRLVSNSQGVPVTNGLFSIKLGDITPLPASLFASGELYLEIELPSPATATSSSPSWTEGAMSPRNQLATSAYAYNSETLDGLDSVDFGQLVADNTWTGSNTWSGADYNFNATNDFNVNTDGFVNIISENDLYLEGGATTIWSWTDIVGSLKVEGGANGNSTKVFQVTNDSAVDLFSIDKSTSRVYVGSDTADATGTILVLDTKNTAGDPTGVNGAMYYNSNAGKFRCYQNGAWSDCIGAGGGSSNADTLDSIDSSQFVRNDTANTISGGNQTTLLGLSQKFAINDGTSDVFQISRDASGEMNWWGEFSSIELATPNNSAYFGMYDSNFYFEVPDGIVEFYTDNFVIGSGWGTLLRVGDNTTNPEVKIGNGSNETPVMFVLNSKSGAGDPTGFGYTNGSMYYNASSNKFRCYENSTWKDCITAASTNADTLDSLDSTAFSQLSANNTYTGTQSFNGSTVSIGGATNSNKFNVANLFNVDSSNSRVSIGLSDTTGTVLVLDTKTGSGDPTGVNGAMYYNSNAGKFRCFEGSAWKDCITVASTNADTLDSLDSTAFGQIGSNNTWTGTQAFNGSTFAIAGTANTAKFSVDNIFAIDTVNSVITIGKASGNTDVRIGSSTDNVSFSSTGITLNGTARPTRTVTFAPEYAGATFTGDGSNNTGTLNSDFCSHSALLNINSTACNNTGDEHNYYAWTTTQGTAQDYDIYIRYRMPADYDAGTMANLRIWGWGTTSASEIVSLALYKGSGTACGSITNAITANTTWNEAVTASPLGACSIAANDLVTFKVKVTAGTSKVARAGEIRFEYKSKF